MDEETKKIVWVVVSAIVVSIIGAAIWGVLGAALGFILTILVIKLFSVWSNYKE